jgi:hypothetical protein
VTTSTGAIRLTRQVETKDRYGQSGGDMQRTAIVTNKGAGIGNCGSGVD